ncbi:cation:dicarboxylate symporter family transporter [Azotosporobacter soli]|uniref:cation:dicarboxylate symporter family transporter n=1 Tax=Azotosporobacter soli TaxID=3055040 RepID=UPI0031FF2576
MKKMKFGLGTQILIGLILGVAVGAFYYGDPNIEGYLKPIGDIFIRMIKMIVAPIVLSSLIVGIAGVGDTKKLGKIGGKTILFFEVVTTIAIVMGLLIGNIVKPGIGIDNMGSLAKSNISNYVNTAESVGHHSFADTFVNIVPSNVFDVLAKGDMLPIIFFSVIFGLGVAAIGEKGKPVLHFFEGMAEAMFWVTNQIMKFAPFGVFALIGSTVAKFGLQSLIPLGKLVVTVYGSMFFFVFSVLALIARVYGLKIMNLIRVLKDELILAYTTASSEAVLPNIMTKMEQMGCPKAITSFVIPTGYSFNLTGSTLYQAVAAIFLAQMYGIELSVAQQINLMVVLMVTSKGIAGVPGVSFVVLLATLGTVGIPAEGLAFIAGVDRFLDMARTVVNVIGNALAAIVISKSEKQYDEKKEEEILRQAA